MISLDCLFNSIEYIFNLFSHFWFDDFRSNHLVCFEFTLNYYFSKNFHWKSNIYLVHFQLFDYSIANCRIEEFHLANYSRILDWRADSCSYRKFRISFAKFVLQCEFYLSEIPACFKPRQFPWHSAWLYNLIENSNISYYVHQVIHLDLSHN